MSEGERSNTPELRFPQFDDPFNKAQLESITKKKISYGIVQAGPNIPGGMPYIKSKDLNFPLEIESLERTSDVIAQKYKRSEVEPGDIVFSLRGNIGLSQILPPLIKVANLTQGTARISVSENISNLYIQYVLQSSRVIKRVLSVAKGSTFQEISLFDLRQIEVLIPVFGEQQKIAAALQSVDDKLTQLRHKQQLLQTYKRGIMQKIFTQQLRFSGFSSSWKSSNLQDLGVVISDGNYGELYPKADQFVKKGVPFIRANNLRDGCITWSEMRFIDTDLHSTLTSGHLKANDILVSTRGEIGTISIVEKEFEGANINAQICLIRDAKYCSQTFLFYSLLTYQVKKQFKMLTTGSALKQLPRKNLRQIVVKFPEIKEQQKIADFLTAIDTKIDAVTQQITQIETFKKGLLQKMFV
jgi:type I restriction enzyme S subunit